MGLVMAAIVAATLLGLVYLTQTLGSNATTSEIGLLEAQRADLHKEVRRHQTLVLRKADEDAIRAQARRLKLKPLDDAIVLTAP